MKKKECSHWPEIKAYFEDGKEAAAESVAAKHLNECRSCRQRLYEEKRLTLLLDDLFTAYQKVPVPVLNLKTRLAGVPAKNRFPGLGFQRRPALLTGGLVLSFLVVLFLLYRTGPAPAPIAPGPILVSSKAPAPVGKSPAVKSRGAIHRARGSDKSDPYTITEDDQKTAGTPGDFGQVFWTRFDRTVSAVSFPQEINNLSQISRMNNEKT